MNIIKKSINRTAWTIEGIVCTMLADINKYNIVGGYDYDEYSLFRLCRTKLKKSIKDNNYNKEDIKNLRLKGYLYNMITVPLGEDIAKEYAEFILNRNMYVRKYRLNYR